MGILFWRSNENTHTQPLTYTEKQGIWENGKDVRNRQMRTKNNLIK
jgi:hypothetical protein